MPAEFDESLPGVGRPAETVKVDVPSTEERWRALTARHTTLLPRLAAVAREFLAKPGATHVSFALVFATVQFEVSCDPEYHIALNNNYKPLAVRDLHDRYPEFRTTIPTRATKAELKEQAAA